MEILFEFLAEFLIQILGEALIELGFHSIAETFRNPANPWLVAIGFCLLGALLGGLRLLIFPTHFISMGYIRFINLLIIPVAVGFSMALLGAWRENRCDPVLRIDRYSFGYLFALFLALIRFLFAE
jgi:hypothetical protein